MDKKKKLGNKGFSLVELIIVIAIMVLLVGLLAPQYIKYLDKSRIAADRQLADNIRQAMATTLLDPDVTGAIKESDTGVIPAPAQNAAVTEYWTNVYGILGVAGPDKLKEKLKYDGDNAIIEYDVDSKKNITVSIYGGKYGADKANALIVIN